MKKILKNIILVIILLLGITGCNKTKEIIIDAKVYKTDIYKLSVNEFNNKPLDDLLNLAILANKYSDKIEEIKKYAKSEVKRIRESYELYGYNFEEVLKQNNFINEEDLYEYLFYEKMKEIATLDYAKLTIPEEDIEKYYQDEVYGDIDSKHILVAIDDDTTDEEAERLANEIISKLDNGKTFDEVKEEYADLIIYEELGYQSYNDNIESSYMKEIKSLSNNSYSKTPVKTSYGYHVIYKIDQKEKPVFDDVKYDIIEMFAYEKLEEDYYNISLTTLEKLQEETYNYLKNNNIEELLIDANSYVLYDENGKSVYGECINTKCNKIKYYKLDLEENNIIELNEKIY